MSVTVIVDYYYRRNTPVSFSIYRKNPDKTETWLGDVMREATAKHIIKLFKSNWEKQS